MKFKSQLRLTSSICLEFFCYIFTLTLDIPFHSVERKRKFFQTPYFECKGKLGFQFLHLFQQVSLSLQSHSRLIRRPAYSLVKKGASLLAVNDQLKGAAAPWQILENYQVKSWVKGRIPTNFHFQFKPSKVQNFGNIFIPVVKGVSKLYCKHGILTVPCPRYEE